jgi:chemotaxis family two-component system sensor kinase Cph1
MQGQAVAGDAVAARSGWWALGARSVRVETPESDGDHADDFAFVVSHDLKQPIQGIRAYCELLLDDYHDALDAEGRRRLNVLIRLCDRLAGSISGLLQYYRAGKVPPARDEVDLGTLAAEVVETFRPVIESRRASVEMVDPLPVVQCDASLVAAVLGNLISNGLKFNQSDEPRVEIGCLAGDPPVIWVRDNGIGIAEQDREEVFVIFRRLHSRQDYEGTGAGLTIVRKIVEAHGGRIWLESEPGRGTTFFFTLGPPTSDSKPAETPSSHPHWARRTTSRPERREA